MRFRKLTVLQQAFVDLNPEMIEITYYPIKTKIHRIKPSIFRITRGYAFLYSTKILKHFRKCDVIKVTCEDKEYASIEHAILGKTK